MLIGWLTTRELINTGLLVGDLCMIYVLCAHLAREVRNVGWLSHPYNQGALALLVYFFGTSISRAWAAMLLWQLERGGDIFAIENAYPISMLGSFIAFLGVLLIVRNFSPAKWGTRRPWIIVLIVTVFLTGIIYLTFNVEEETLLKDRIRVTEEIQQLIDVR